MIFVVFLFNIGNWLTFQLLFLHQILQSSARKSSTAVICMSLKRTALPNFEAAFPLVVCGRETFGLKIENAGVLKIFFWSLHLVAWLGRVSCGQ